jgi:hypothetical protein
VWKKNKTNRDQVIKVREIKSIGSEHKKAFLGEETSKEKNVKYGKRGREEERKEKVDDRGKENAHVFDCLHKQTEIESKQ